MILPDSSTPVATAAMMYLPLALAPVLVYGVNDDGTCQCGAAVCKKPGKHPMGREWQKLASTDPEKVRDTFKYHHGNIGLYLGGSGFVVVDADGDEGLATLKAWNVPPTLRAQSGSGRGAHLLYKLGEKQEEPAITDRRVAPGVDVKIRGQFVVAPSKHFSGGHYTWTENLPVATLPDWLYERIKKPSPLYSRAEKYIAKADAAVSGAGGHNTTFAVARALVGWMRQGLPEEQAWRLFADYNLRCEPPWEEHELRHKFQDAALAHTIPNCGDRNSSAPPPPPSAPDSVPDVVDGDYIDVLLGKTSRNGNKYLLSNVENVTLILQLAPEWKGKITYDAFRCRIEVRDLPWNGHFRPTHKTTHWTDEDGTRLVAWMQRKFHHYDFNPTLADCERAVDVVARNHSFHPVLEYLNGLVWDGTPRLDHWLERYVGAEPGDYTTMIGRWWLIGAVARIMSPGCKLDTVPVLEGNQGLMKSTLIKTLAGPQWFTDTAMDLSSKDAYQAIQGVWFVEFPELLSILRANYNLSKTFLGSSTDKYRPPYGRRIIEAPRQCIFVGTVNQAEYLSDPTGARRFWPIKCGRLDVRGVEADRDQLWAEAVTEYLEGKPWYATSVEEEELLGERQSSRTVQDSWAEKIGGYFDRHPEITSIRSDQVLESALTLPTKDWSNAASTRVGIIMHRLLGWEKRRSMSNGRRSYVYEKTV